MKRRRKKKKKKKGKRKERRTKRERERGIEEKKKHNLIFHLSLLQADLHFLRQQQQQLHQDQTLKGVNSGKLSPLKPVNPLLSSIAASASSTAKQPVRATASLPVTGPSPPTPSSKLVHQGSLDATLLSVQTNIPEMDESASSTSSGVRSPSFYGFK